MERQQQQQDSSDEPKKMYEYEDSKDEEENTYWDENTTKPNQLFEEVERVIEDDNVERLEWLFLTLHFNLHAERLHGNKTPLTLASMFGHSHSVAKLLEWAADVNRGVGSGDQPIHMAAFGGSINCLLKYCPLEWAVDVNWEDGDGQQPIHEAACSGSVDCLDLLIFHVDRSKRDYQRKLIPTTNAWKGRGEPTKYLVPYNHFRGDIDVRSRYGSTALHRAVSWNKIYLVHYLLNLGADVNAEDSGKQTPGCAWGMFYEDGAEFDRQQQYMIFHLWFEGADVNARARDDKNPTPLGMAREILRIRKDYKYGDDEEDKWKQLVAMMEFLIEGKKKHESLHRYVALRNEITDESLSELSRRKIQIQIAIDEISKLKLTDLFRLHHYLLEYYTTYFLKKLKRDTDYLVFHSRFSENKEHVDEWFEDEEF